MYRLKQTLFCFLALLLGGNSLAEAKPDLSKPVTQLDVADFRGRVWKMEDFDDANLIVVAFLGTECPLAKLYASRLNELEEEYSKKGVAFLGVMSNRQDSIAEISAYVRQFNLSFPILKDAGNRLADAMGAERTPEVYVLDRQRMIRYWGRIDDQYGIGYVREKPATFDLKNAVEDLLAGSEPRTPITRSVGCIIGRQKSVDESASVTFTDQVVRILNRRCVECHREGEIGPFALSDYHEAAGWADMIAEVVRDGRMPPWHASPEVGKFSNDRSLTEEEKQTLYAWAEAGAPQGNPDELPEPPTFVTGWQLPREPDMVVPMSETPYQVEATGEVPYRHFIVPLPFTEDKWLAAAELQPGNRSVVHHILCFVRPKGSKGGIEAARNFLVGYVPGARVEQYPKGMAKRIPANSELVFQMHYTPTGTPQEDISKLGLVFAKPDEITHELATFSAIGDFKIEPYKANQVFPGGMREALPTSSLLAFSPHMHLRGKAFKYELLKPNGERELLLDVPNYDFNWQTTYMLSEPIDVSPGSRIICEAVFDNSAKNLNNPDPSQVVTWGEQTDDEMLIGYFHYSVELDEKGKPRPTLLNTEKQRLLEIFDRLDRDNDGEVQIDQVPADMRKRAKRLDSNGDGVLTRSEVENS